MTQSFEPKCLQSWREAVAGADEMLTVHQSLQDIENCRKTIVEVESMAEMDEIAKMRVDVARYILKRRLLEC